MGRLLSALGMWLRLGKLRSKRVFCLRRWVVCFGFVLASAFC